MRLVSLELESTLRDKGLWPESRMARAGVYVLFLDIVFFLVQTLTRGFSPKVSASVGGWVSFLSGLAIFFFAIVGFRFVRAQLLWRLRNRLIVTYMFIGVIPVFLLLMISLITLYLLAGQFASFVVTSEIAGHLRSIESANRTIANNMATRFELGEKAEVPSFAGVRSRNPSWARREVCAWIGAK